MLSSLLPKGGCCVVTDDCLFFPSDYKQPEIRNYGLYLSVLTLGLNNIIVINVHSNFIAYIDKHHCSWFFTCLY